MRDVGVKPWKNMVFVFVHEREQSSSLLIVSNSTLGILSSSTDFTSQGFCDYETNY